MTAMTQYLQKKVGDHVLGIASYTMPNPVYLSLHTASPTESGLHSFEITGNNYSRVSLAAKLDAVVLATGRSTLNATVTFPTPTAGTSWGDITHIGIEDAASAGNMLMYSQLVSGRRVDAANVFELLAGQLVVEFA